MSDLDCDLLIVGGGPTGVTLGLLAAHHGASVIICEREADVYPLPRAAHVDHEVMRIFQSARVADEIAATSRTTTHYDFLTADGEILLRFDGSDQIGPGGWPAANMIHQPSVERALRKRLARSGNAELRSHWNFTGFDEDEEGVTARFATPEGEQTIRTRYLVGADGTRSPVREAAKIELDDLQFDEPWLVIDAIVHDYDRLPKVNLQICDPARPTTCVLMGEGRHRWEFMMLPGETAEQVCDEAFVAELLKPWNVEGAVTIERKAVYRFNARVAKQWIKGRVLLAGDAAHQTPPFAGQGMCAGIRDAANLGWKIALVTKGGASDAILESYQLEREPHVRATISLAVMMGQTVCITDQNAAATRNAQMLAARAAGQSPDGSVSFPSMAAGIIMAGTPEAGSYFPQLRLSDGSRLDDQIGEGPWLVARDRAGVHQGIRTLSLRDCESRPMADALAGWLDSHHTDAVLIRPDHHIFGTGSAELLVSEWAKATGFRPPV